MNKKKILIVSANFYSNISMKLSADAEGTLKLAKIKFERIEVPGVFEIPVVIAKNIKKYDGFIALGCVIKGETPHFDFISKSTIDAIMQLSTDYKKPIGNGILTCLNMEQAKVRADFERKYNKKGFKGRDAARAVIQVLNNF